MCYNNVIGKVETARYFILEDENMEKDFESEDMDEEQLDNIEEEIENDNEDNNSDNEESEDDTPKKELGKGAIAGIIVALVAVLGVGTYILFGALSTTCTIKFDTNGGNKIEKQKVKKGESVIEPEEPVKPGNTFLGWYVGNREYDFSKKVKSSFTLHAKWENNNTADVEGVELDQNEVALLPGDSMPLIVNVLPSDARDQTVKWSSSDEDIVTVDEYGNIKAIAIGSATVTVTTNEGDFEAKCRVVVSKYVVKVTGLDVEEESIELASGEKVRVKTTVSPNNATNTGLIWKSDDPSVATVSSTGLITGVKKGTTVVSATTKDGGFEKRIDVSVDEIALKSISIPSELTIQIGKSDTLDVTFTPKNVSNKDVEWESNNEKIATVDENGKVTAKKIGTALITVKAKEGNKKATCKVTVSEKEEINVKLNKTEITLEEGKSEHLNATITPNNDSNKGIAWSSSDKSIVTVNNGKITAVGEGEATVTVTSIVDRSKSATCTVKVTPLPKNYTYTVEEVKEEKNVTEKDEEKTEDETPVEETVEDITYKLKVYENNKDVTSKVTKISGITIDKTGETIILSKEEGEKLSSTIEVTINGKVVSASKK